MVWFLVILIVLLVIGLLFQTSCFKCKGVYCALIGFVFFFFNAFKVENFTGDIINYKYYYNLYGEMSWVQVYERIVGGYKDVVFYVLGKLVYSLNGNFRIWLIILAMLSSGLITVTIYKYSENVAISFLMFICIGYYYFSMTAVRQSIAMAFVLFSWKELSGEKKVFLKFLLYILIASCFHKAAIIFLIMYPLVNSQIYRWWWLEITVVISTAYLVTSPFIYKIGRVVPQQYVNYFSGVNNTKLNWSGFIIQLAIFCGCYLVFYLSGKKDQTLSTLLNVMIIGVCIQIGASTINSIFFRLSMYFSIFNIIAVPRALTHIKKTERKSINALVYIILCLYFAMSTGSFLGNYSLIFGA